MKMARVVTAKVLVTEVEASEEAVAEVAARRGWRWQRPRGWLR